MLAALEVVPPRFERFNNGQQLALVALIPSLGWNHLSGKKGYRILLARIIQDQLTENLTNSIARSICFNSDMTLRIKMI